MRWLALNSFDDLTSIIRTSYDSYHVSGLADTLRTSIAERPEIACVLS
jgi:hypothetical protein